MRCEREAEPVTSGTDGHQGLGDLKPWVERQRAHHPLAVVEFEELLHRVAVTGGGRNVIEARHIRRAEIGEEHDVGFQGAGHDGHHLVAFSEPGGGRGPSLREPA